MEQYIKLIETDVFGLETGVNVFMQVKGKKLTDTVREKIHDAIKAYKKENVDKYDTDGCIDTAIEALKGMGYTCGIIMPFEIRF